MKKNRIITWLLVAALSAGMISTTAFADEIESEEAGIANSEITEEEASEDEITEDGSSENEISPDDQTIPDAPVTEAEPGKDDTEIEEGLTEDEYTAAEKTRLDSDAFDFKDGEALKALMEEAESYPDFYDLRHVQTEGGGEVSYVTPVKLQNPYGTCWGFAAISAAESSLLSSGFLQGYDSTTLDLSEKQLAFFAYSYITDPKDPQYGEGTHFRNIPADQEDSYSYVYDPGGWTIMATRAFSEGIGPVLEKWYDEDSGQWVEDPVLAYRGKRSEKAYWEVATQYDDNGNPVEDSYEDMAVWYSNQDDWSIPEDYKFIQDFSLKDSIVLPSPAGNDINGNYEYQPEAVEAIKQQLVKYNRAVSVSFCAESYLPGQDTTGKKYMSKNWAHYTNTFEASTHTVTIVGYDDNYPKENFDSDTSAGGSAQPEGNGAFLIKNSWGSEMNEFPTNGYRHWGILDGQDGVPYDPEASAAEGNRATGYFWISYYDRSLSDPEAFVFEGQVGQNGYYIEQMDYMNSSTYWLKDNDGSKMANVFAAEATSKLCDISVMTTVPGTDVLYKVYLLGEGYTDPEDGILIDEGEEYFDYGGYHKIDLNNQIVLAKGQQFSVVINEDFEGYDYVCYSVDADDGNYKIYSVGVINEGESYYHNGIEWGDLSSEDVKDELDYDYPGLIMDNFPIKSYLEPITYPDGEDEHVFDGYLTINNWADGNRGTYDVLTGDSKTVTAEFRGFSEKTPESWKPVFTWQTVGEGILDVATSTPRKGKAVLTGLEEGTEKLIVSAGTADEPGIYGVRVITINVNDPKLTSADFKDGELPVFYTGKPIEPDIVNVKAEVDRGELTEGVDYVLHYEDNVNAGDAIVIVEGIGNYSGSVEMTFKIEPADNTLKVKGKTPSVKYSEKAQTIALSKAITFTDKGQGTKTYVKASGSKSISVDKTTGKITIGKGLKTGTYSLEVKVKAAGDKNHGAVTKKVTVKITITAANNTLKVKGKSATVKYSDLQKKSQTLALSKTITFTDKGEGTKTYAKASGDKKITVDKTTGKITVGKGLKAGTYTVKIDVTAKGDKNHKAATKQAAVKITVRK